MAATPQPPDDPATTQAKLEKLLAEARSAQVKADADARAEREAASAGAVAQREAERRQKTAEADKAAATAKREQLTALIPDLSKLSRGELERNDGGPALFAAALVGRSIDVAANDLVQGAMALFDEEGWRLLVTSDAELAASHAAYVDIVTALDRLILAAESVRDAAAVGTEEFVPTAVVGALMSQLPALLSLFSSHRKLSTETVTVDDLAAAAATVAAIRRVTDSGVIVHDDFRVLATGGVHRRLNTLADRRTELVSAKLTLETVKAEKSARLATARKEIEELEKQLEKAPADEDLEKRLRRKREQLVPLETETQDATVKLGLVDGHIQAIDEYTTAVTAVPDGAKHSPLTLAALREHLLDPEPPEGAEREHDSKRFTNVLLVKGNGGSVSETLDDKAMWAKDTFGVVATASITYVLIETADGQVVAAGNAVGSASASGRIRDGFELQIRPPAPRAASD